MRHHLQELLKQVNSEKPDVHKEAILRVALVVELNSIAPESRRANRDDFALTLPEELLDVVLSSEEIRSVVEYLCEVYLKSHQDPGILWAIGKSKLPEAFDILLDIALRADFPSDEEAAFQVVSSLQQFTWRSGFVLAEDSKQKLWKLMERCEVLESPRLQEALSYLRQDLERIKDSYDSTGEGNDGEAGW